MRTEAGAATALVSGVAGFIGSHVAAELCRQGKTVVGLDDLSGGFQENVPADVRFVEGSVNDAGLISKLFSEYRFKYVFHFAACAAQSLSQFIPHFNYANNLLGAVRLINASVNSGTVRCFVFSSSAAVYGKAAVTVTEETPPNPLDPYGISKYAVELQLAAAREAYGLNSIIFRAHNVYGPGQHIGDPNRNIVGIFIKQVLLGQPLTVVGDGSQTRAFSYISDLAPIMAASVDRLDAYNQVFNIGSDRSCSLLDLARLVCRTMGVECRVRFITSQNQTHQALCSHDKLRAAFGELLTDVPLETGVARMADWSRRTGVRRAPRCPAREILVQQPDHALAFPPCPRVP